MELKPRFTNRVVRSLQEQGINVFELGSMLTERETILKLMVAAHPGEDPQSVTAAYDDLTPGEATGILTESLMRDLLPKSQREAVAKAATEDKSE